MITTFLTHATIKSSMFIARSIARRSVSINRRDTLQMTSNLPACFNQLGRSLPSLIAEVHRREHVLDAILHAVLGVSKGQGARGPPNGAELRRRRPEEMDDELGELLQSSVSLS
jgi:hypothetical protein